MSKIQEALKKIQGTRGPLRVVRDSIALKKPDKVPLHKEEVSQSEIVNADDTETIYFGYDAFEGSAHLSKHPSTRNALDGEFEPVIRRIRSLADSADSSAATSPVIILVCSFGPSPGRTFISLNLAISLAQFGDDSVLLIDGNFRDPEISTALGISERPGFLNLMSENSADFDELIIQTSLGGLSVMSVGDCVTEASGLNEYSAFSSAVDTIRENCATGKVVIVDCTQFSDAMALKNIDGALVMYLVVVRAGKDGVKEIKSGSRRIGDLPAEYILNQA